LKVLSRLLTFFAYAIPYIWITTSYRTYGSINESWIVIAGLIATFLILLFCGAYLNDQYERKQQNIRDQKASRIAASGIRPNEPFFIYLRPFVTTNRFRLSKSKLPIPTLEEVWERDGYDDLERILARTLTPTASFLAIGQPGEHRGAGRIPAEETNWKSKVERLVQWCDLVFIIPSHREGTFWEIQQLIEKERLPDCIFIMPPSQSTFFTRDISMEQEWEETPKACRKLGILLPNYSPRGGFFKINIATSQVGFETLPPTKPNRWRQSIQKVLDSDLGTIKTTLSTKPANFSHLDDLTM
jgi:hypothetical protein